MGGSTAAESLNIFELYLEVYIIYCTYDAIHQNTCNTYCLDGFTQVTLKVLPPNFIPAGWAIISETIHLASKARSVSMVGLFSVSAKVTIWPLLLPSTKAVGRTTRTRFRTEGRLLERKVFSWSV